MNDIPKQKEFGRAETIAERKARQAYDKAHPWRPIIEATIDHSICELQFSDMVGHIDSGHRRFVLLGIDRWKHQVWWQINPSKPVFSRPMSFRQTGAKVTTDRLRRLLSRADHEFIGGVRPLISSGPNQRNQDR